MPLTNLQEAFAQAVANGANFTDAYKQAGYSWESMLPSTLNNEAWTLSIHPDISQRIEQLRQQIEAARASELKWDAARFVQEATTNLQGARSDHQWASANGALQLIGNAAGLLNPQSDSPNVTVNKTVIVLQQRDGSTVTQGLAAADC